MTINDESSVYVGGLPYDATEETVRRVFELYGNVVAVKIINDTSTRGKCYGFVTFRNPRSAILAISEMDGRTVDGRVIRVNEVRSRGGRLSFGRGRERESFRRNAERGRNWDRGRDHERDFDRDRDRYNDRYSDRSRERGRDRSLEDDGEERDRRYEGERDYDHARDRYEGERDYDHARDHFLDGDHDQDRDAEDNEQGQSRNRNQGWERDRALESDRDTEMDITKSHDSIGDKDRDDQSRRWSGSNTVDRQSRDLISHPSDDSNVQVKEQLERSTRRFEEIKNETVQMEESLDEKEKLVLDLQKKSKKLEDALMNAKKNSSHQKLKLTRLHITFMQVKDFTERLKSCEHELQSLVDTEMSEHGSDDVGLRDEILTIGNA